jgi:hypothetical protein
MPPRIPKPNPLNTKTRTQLLAHIERQDRVICGLSKTLEAAQHNVRGPCLIHDHSRDLDE